MTRSSHASELEVCLRIARRAAEIVREVYATAFTVEMKSPGDPVTRADREANELICEALAKAFPGDAVVAEESVPAADEVARRVAERRVWFVDPLDGTREFAARNGEFAVMIGLAEEGRATLGVLVLPATGVAFGGASDVLAFTEDAAGARSPARMSPEADPARATLLVSRSHKPEIIEAFTRTLGVGGVLACGSVGVKIARILTGDGHLYVHGGQGIKLWDACGPEAVLRAAGGRFTDLDGAELDYTSPHLDLPKGIVASNGAIHDAALAALRPFREQHEPPGK